MKMGNKGPQNAVNMNGYYKKTASASLDRNNDWPSEHFRDGSKESQKGSKQKTKSIKSKIEAKQNIIEAEDHLGTTHFFSVYLSIL